MDPVESNLDEQAIRDRSLSYLAALGVKTHPGLPLIGITKPRSREDIVDRALVVLALFNLTLDAPVNEISAWISSNRLRGALSIAERELLAKSDDDITEQERIDLSWSIETLYALMWIGGLVEGLSPERPLPEGLAELSPNLEADEDGRKFVEKMRLRSYSDLYAMRDLLYNAHWSARDLRLTSIEDGALSEELVMERRKALEWALDVEMDWDDVDMST